MFEYGVDGVAVEPDNNIAVHIYNRNAILAGFLHGFCAPGGVLLYVAVFVLHAKFVEVTHGLMTKGAPFRPIHDNCIHTSIVSPVAAIQRLVRFRHPAVGVVARAAGAALSVCACSRGMAGSRAKVFLLRARLLRL